jgi:hypothetical protein
MLTEGMQERMFPENIPCVAFLHSAQPLAHAVLLERPHGTLMLSKLFVAWGLMAACVAIHATGVTSAVRWLRPQVPTAPQVWPWTWLFVRLAGWIVVLHLIEIAAWGLFYVWTHALPELQSALYFSAVTYTTTGYGDLVLPKEWQLVGAVEALTGILMCGWSTGFFVAVVGRMFTTVARPVNPTT